VRDGPKKAVEKHSADAGSSATDTGASSRRQAVEAELVAQDDPLFLDAAEAAFDHHENMTR